MLIDKNIDRYDFIDWMGPVGFEYHPLWGPATKRL